MTMPMPGSGTPNRKPRNAGERRAKAVETVTGTGAGAIGSVFGAAKLRDTYKTDKPGNDVKLKRAVTHAGMKAMGSDPSPRRVARVARAASAVEHEHPPFKALATAVTLGATATAAHRYQEIEHWAQQRKQELGKAASAEGYVGTRRAGPKVRVAVPKREPRHLRAAGAHRDLTQRGDRARAAYRAAALQHGTKMMAALRQSGELLKADACLAGDGTLGSSALEREQLMAMSAFGVEMIGPVSKAVTGQPGDKRNTKYAGAAYGGAAAGGAVGRQIATRTAGTTPGDVGRLARSRAQMSVEDALAGKETPVSRVLDQHMDLDHPIRSGFKGGRAAVKTSVADLVHNTPGAARMVRGGKVGAAAGAVGGTAAYAAHRHKKAGAVAKSAFGVEMIGKAAPVDPDTGKRPTTGRYVAGYLAAPIHGAVAGKKGKKVAAAGSELGHGMGGALAGMALGAATKKPALASALGTAGGVGGSVMGVNSNQRKGRYKPQSTS